MAFPVSQAFQGDDALPDRGLGMKPAKLPQAHDSSRPIQHHQNQQQRHDHHSPYAQMTDEMLIHWIKDHIAATS
jgi:hypothetical protein